MTDYTREFGETVTTPDYQEEDDYLEDYTQDYQGNKRTIRVALTIYLFIVMIRR